MSEASTPALLRAVDLRVDVSGVPACDGLTFETRGDRVLVLGAPKALFEAACRARPVARGALDVRGAVGSVASASPAALGQGRAGIAGVWLDPPLPPTWTPVDYVVWSARLAGRTKADASRLGAAAVEAMQLGALAETKLPFLLPHARRGVVVAGALAADPAVVLLEDPLVGLPDEIARVYAAILVEALADRPWVAFASRVAVTSPLVVAADEALIVSATQVEARGAPAALAAATRRYVARAHGPLDALGARLAERGASLETRGAQVLFDLGEALTTAELLGLSAESNVTIVELLPLSRAFA